VVNQASKWIALGFGAYALLAAGAWIWVTRAAGPRVVAALRDVTPAQAGLVLGASPIRRDGTGPNRYFLYRIDAAAALYRAGKVKYLIVSGDRRDDGYDEPTAMRDALTMAGVPAERIYRDAAGFHTRDSLARAHALFGQDDAIVISQRFHAERAVFVARAHGLRFTGYAARDVDAYSGVRTIARETFSRIVALIDAVSPERASAGKRIALGADAPT
jgi:SanA protein